MFCFAGSVYIFVVSMCETVGKVHRSHVGWSRDVCGEQIVVFLRGFRNVGWGRFMFNWYVGVFLRGFWAKFQC